eukprot:m.35362 g.35362  ORF g.35362 m.35362 type:complete len:495 (-) comp11131_c2_seq1:37-1521(-)
MLETSTSSHFDDLTPPERLDLPVYTRADVEQHSSIEQRIWVSWQHGVYDVTSFVEQHPGGEKILLAAGSALEPFWSLYRQHLTKDVMAVIEQFRIGSLSPEDIKASKASFDANDPYRTEPQRHPALVVHQDRPFNAEMPPALSMDSYLTPASLFYVRHHHPVPVVEENAYVLQIGGVGITPLSLSLQDLKTKFSAVEVTATLQCGGNRRSELNATEHTQGLKWTTGAISTATWKGVRLRDVLEAAGLTEAEANRLGVRFINLYPLDPPYDASVPVDKALSVTGDVILAYEMNGQSLPPDHGFPLRAIVPGYIGARSVKWLSKIEASTEESESTWQRGIPYKMCPSHVKTISDELDVGSLPSVNEMPVQSAIMSPACGAIVSKEDESVHVRGYAWSGGGRNIVRVDVSADGGETWMTATLLEGSDQKANRAWAWTFWEADVPLNFNQGKKVQLVCRAVDSSANQQPESPSSVWNLRGILNNSWHRVDLNIEEENV